MPFIATITIVVPDYDEAITYYTTVCGFVVQADYPLDAHKRWVVVGPPDGRGCQLLLAKASSPAQMAHIGNQTGGRVAFFLQSDTFAPDYARMQALGVDFIEAPRHESYGWVVKWRDRYGNLWDLLGS